MELKDFWGKKVIRAYDNQEFIITEITSYQIEVKSVAVNSNGNHSYYTFESMGNSKSNAIANGDLVFVDETLKEPFLKLYDEYCKSEEGIFESYSYYLFTSYN